MCLIRTGWDFATGPNWLGCLELTVGKEWGKTWATPGDPVIDQGIFNQHPTTTEVYPLVI